MPQEPLHKDEPPVLGTESVRAIPPHDQTITDEALYRTNKAFQNLPNSSEKLTDSTLPLTWPSPYLGHLRSREPSEAFEATYSFYGDTTTFKPSEEHVQLLHKLQNELMVTQESTRIDRALCAAHYISTLLAALAFSAMMAIILLTCFPSLLSK